LLILSAAARAEEKKAADVLRLAQAKLEEASVTGTELANLSALVDGDPRTVVTATAKEEAPLTVVYGFGGETVAIEELVITLPAKAGDASGPVRVDLLVSTLSPHAGFQSVRTDPLAPTIEPQKFSLRPIGAKWIMLRFTPEAGASRAAIADVAIVGHKGPPVTHYQFKQSPAKAFDVLRRLKKSSAIEVGLTPDEINLFADARDGKLDEWTFDEAALIASGVVDGAKRKAYLKRLDEIEAAARQATKKLRKPFEKGRALLQFLHAGPMSKGYASEQTDVATILDLGTFNCVSSATLFNMIGRRLGLDCRGVEVPQHAFSIVYDGVSHADVETTTDGGFNPARDAAAREQFEKLTGFAYIPESNRDERREIGDIGLVALTYYNHGVTLSAQKRFHEALLAYFRAMSLDLESDSAVKNALAALANWSLELAEEMRFEEALNVLGTGLDLAPEDATLVNNRKAVWSDWAESLMEAGKNDEAINLLRRAAEQVPDGRFLERQAWVFIRQGENHIKAGSWEKAIALVEPGLQKLDGVAREELVEWGGNLYHRWAQAEQKAGNYDKALDIVQRAIAERPDDGELVNHLAYIIQERAREIHAENPEQATRLMSEMLTRFGAYEDVREVAQSYAYRSVKELAEKGRYDEALAAAERLGRSLKSPEMAVSLSRSIFDQQAGELAKQKQWQAAIDIYGKSLERMQGDEHLTNNLRAMWRQWAASFEDKRDWAGALGVYERQRKQMPADDIADNNIRYGVQEWAQSEFDVHGSEAAEKVLVEQLARFKDIQGIQDVALGYFQRIVRKLSDEAKYAEALAVAERGETLLSDKVAAADLPALVYDIWAKTFVDKKDWLGAIDVYAKGIEKFPQNDHLQQNTVATWHQWAKTLMDKQDWAGAAAVYEKALAQFRDDGTLKNNLEYCREKAK
jgi:tetratricopeptide (TPR) repeat protein